MCVVCGRYSYLQFLPLLGDVTLLQAHGPEEVSEVAEQGDDAKAQVGHDSHVHGRLFKGLVPACVLSGGGLFFSIFLKKK